MKEPKDADLYNWDMFIRYADNQGISLECECDWEPWWKCWKQGYITAMNG